MTYLEIAGGLILLIVGAELLVRGSVGVARQLGVSPMLIGLTLVGFGTSSPELVASIAGALRGSPGIAVGNVVGSNICNVFLILGLSAVFLPLSISRKAFIRDGSMLLVVTLVLVGLAFYGSLSRIVGVVLVAALAAYLFFSYRQEKQSGDAVHVHEAEAASVPSLDGSRALGIAASLAGLAVLVGGAYLLVEGAIELARGFGVSETIIGLTIVAIGTSLPELATSVIAAVRRQSDVAFGNVVGSCVYNVLGILGVTAIVHPIAIPPEIAGFDVWVMLASAVLLSVFAITGWRIARWEGAVLLALYALYIGHLVRVAAVV